MNELHIPALRLVQGGKHILYCFAVEGKLLHSFASISRIHRDTGGEVAGYQRAEVRSHIAEIRRYLESDDPLLPNALVVAFDDRVRFDPGASVTETPGAQSGVLLIPTNQTTDSEQKVGWIVDGQQRAAALREAALPGFAVWVTAFITGSLEEQREQFILVNSTKPLPKGLIYELLPATDGALPNILQRRRFPALLVDRLNRDPDSPFCGRVESPTNPNGIVKDNSLLRMVENSLTDGALYRFRGTDDDHDTEGMLEILKAFWGAVRDTFGPAWNLPPRRSRLMHGVGIVSLGFLMDAITDRHRATRDSGLNIYGQELVPIKEVCRWTDGYWDFGPGIQRKWNELQNTSRDIQLLTNYLLVHYRTSEQRRSRQTHSETVAETAASVS